MDVRARVRRRAGVAVAVAGIAILGALPATASADIVGDLVNGLGNAVGGGGSADPAPGPAPQAGPPQQKEAGSGPSAQGTVADLDVVVPESGGESTPFSGEEVVVGRSGAQQDTNRNYNGKVTILALFGEEVLGIDSEEGESASSPFQPLQGLLDQICTGSEGNICLALLVANSTTTASGSQNEFGAARADLGQGEQSLSAGVAESHGNLSDDGTCQTADAGSEVARAQSPMGLDVHVLKSGSTSTACSGGAASTQDDSTVLEANGNGLPDDCTGTENGSAGADGVASVGCNVGEPGSRDALTADVLGDQPVNAGLSAASAHSAAAAPDGGTGPDPTDTPGTPPTPSPTQGDGNAPGDGGPGDGGGDTSAPGDGSDPTGPASSDAQPGNGGGDLAFTGANLALLMALGLALLIIGSGMVLQLDRASSRRS